MNITITLNNTDLIIALSGRLDTLTAPELEKTLSESLDNITSLMFDFENLEYVSSAGLRVLLMVQKRMNQQGSMKVINVNEDVMDVFAITGFNDILNIE